MRIESIFRLIPFADELVSPEKMSFVRNLFGSEVNVC